METQYIIILIYYILAGMIMFIFSYHLYWNKKRNVRYLI